MKNEQNTSKEYILCAAIHFDDNKKYEAQPTNIGIGYVVAGLRHVNCYMTVLQLKNETIFSSKTLAAINEDNGKATEGFLTSKGRFVGRAEALQIAYSIGQVAFKREGKQFLYSEDLY